MSKSVPHIRRKLDLLIDCCDSPNITYGHKGGALEDFILCDHCKFEVFGYVLIQMIDNWNRLIRERNTLRKSHLQQMLEQKGSVLKSIEEINKDRELPCMELMSRRKYVKQ